MQAQANGPFPVTTATATVTAKATPVPAVTVTVTADATSNTESTQAATAGVRWSRNVTIGNAGLNLDGAEPVPGSGIYASADDGAKVVLTVQYGQIAKVSKSFGDLTAAGCMKYANAHGGAGTDVAVSSGDELCMVSGEGHPALVRVASVSIPNPDSVGTVEAAVTVWNVPSSQ